MDRPLGNWGVVIWVWDGFLLNVWRNVVTTATFDTLKFVRRLESAGFPSDQAEAVANSFRDASGEAELATRRDLRELEPRRLGCGTPQPNLALKLMKQWTAPGKLGAVF